jgi:hypothetical protein
MIVYVSTDLDFHVNCLVDLQEKRTSGSGQVNFLSCPAVRASWQNVWLFGLSRDVTVEYNLNSAKSDDNPVELTRKPHLKNTNIFNLCMANHFFSESPLKIKITAPYFHNVEYQKYGTFVGGVYDIGRWYRPVVTEIITWQESGFIKFTKNDPMFYAEFLTEEKITLVEYKHTPLLSSLASGLIHSPFQTPKMFQGNLDSRYKAFDKSGFRKAIIEEIQANLVSNSRNN